MNASKIPLVGPGRVQWNAGAWFGSSLGSSAWMLVTALFLLFDGQATLAMIPASGFTLVLIASIVLWSRRNSIYPFAALMSLMVLLAIILPIVWSVVQAYGSPSALAAMNWPQQRWITIVVLAIVPAGILWLLILEKSATSAGTKNKADSNAVA